METWYALCEESRASLIISFRVYPFLRVLQVLVLRVCALRRRLLSSSRSQSLAQVAQPLHAARWLSPRYGWFLSPPIEQANHLKKQYGHKSKSKCDHSNGQNSGDCGYPKTHHHKPGASGFSTVPYPGGPDNSSPPPYLPPSSTGPSNASPTNSSPGEGPPAPSSSSPPDVYSPPAPQPSSTSSGASPTDTSPPGYVASPPSSSSVPGYSPPNNNYGYNGK